MLTQQDQDDNANKGQRHQKPAVAAVWKQFHINGEQPHADKSAHQRAEKTVAAVETALLIAAAHAENRADAGKSRTAVQKIVHQSAQRRRKSRLDVPQPYLGNHVFQSLPRIHTTSPFIHAAFYVSGSQATVDVSLNYNILE